MTLVVLALLSLLEKLYCIIQNLSMVASSGKVQEEEAAKAVEGALLKEGIDDRHSTGPMKVAGAKAVVAASSQGQALLM